MNTRIRMSVKTLLLCIGFSAAASLGVFSQDLTGGEIMQKVDDNQFIASARIESEMIILDRGREIRKEMITYVESDGDDTNALAEFVNPRDRGTKYLLLGDEMWMYFPDAEDLVRISDHMLRDSMMGSDFSYQDVLESEQLTELYDFEQVGMETVDGREAYVVEASASEGKEPAYRYRTFWIDAERFVILREEMYARGGRLLKVMKTERVEEIKEGRWMPLEMVMEDKLREGSETRYKITSIELDYDIPEGTLTLEALQ